MQTEIKEYDLIFSIGGGCATSLQLRKRELQFLSFPFDWLFQVSSSTYSHILSLQKCFEDDFSNWLAKENMENLVGDERGTSELEHQYKDKENGFRYIHDFHFSIDDEIEYLKVKEKHQRRIDRLLKTIQKSKKVLLFLDRKYEIKIEDCESLLKSLKHKFPNTKFDFIAINFGADKQEIVYKNNITIYKYIRQYSDADDFGVPNEWDFLNSIKKLKRGIGIYLFKNIFNIIRIRFLLFGLRLDFCIGKVRD